MKNYPKAKENLIENIARCCVIIINIFFHPFVLGGYVFKNTAHVSPYFAFPFLISMWILFTFAGILFVRRISKIGWYGKY